MAYIGREPQIGNFQICDAISTVNNQAAYTMQVGSVNVSPESANHMIVSLNGVIQKPTDAFTVSGSTITFASNLVTGDVINFIQILGSVLDLGVPSDSTVSVAKLTATGTKNSTTFLRGDNTFASVGGGLTEADQWRLTTNLTLATSATDITANWERVDTSGYGTLGDGMTESSGIFTFPSTGIYLINMKMSGNGGASNYIGNQIFTTTDNSSYVVAADGFSNTAASDYYTTFNQHIFDVTSTSTHKVKFKQFKQGSNTVVANGSTAHSVTYAMFIKLGDT